jgi:hypothetical protein
LANQIGGNALLKSEFGIRLNEWMKERIKANREFSETWMRCSPENVYLNWGIWDAKIEGRNERGNGT